MRSAIVVGGGLAGIAAAAALSEAGYTVDLYEARPFLGGRATSYIIDGETIDNCQHVLMACFDNLLDLYRRLGVSDRIRFHREFYFVEPGGRVSVLKAGRFPAPAHFLEAFARLKFLGAGDKIAIAQAMARVPSAGDCDDITMLDWLREQRQTPRAIERFWRQVLVSAINEELGRMSARYGLQVFRTGFLSSASAYEMGLAAVPLAELYDVRLPGVTVHLRSAVNRLADLPAADAIVCAVPFERLAALAPELDVPAFEHSPITGIHLWFDRPVMDLPHATLLDRTIQWAFNKRDGRYVQLVVSASRSLVETSREQVIELAVAELTEFFPQVRGAALERAHVVKELRATFSARPGLARPGPRTRIPNVFLAGDWTDTGWPATMEGAVRSGYLAAEAVVGQALGPRRTLSPPGEA
jgi:zeta-carotene desaturase